jgi:hypothetical protein
MSRPAAREETEAGRAAKLWTGGMGRRRPTIPGEDRVSGRTG